MKKITVQFNSRYYHSTKQYDFTANDNFDIKENELILVPSAIAESGYAVAKVEKIEEKTNDINHKKIINRVIPHGKLADELINPEIFKTFSRGHLYIIKDMLYYKGVKNDSSLAKELSLLLDKENYDMSVIRRIYTYNEFYTLRKQDVKTENCFEIDLITYKVYIAIEKYTLENEFETKFEDLEFSENFDYIDKLKSINFSEKLDLTEEKEEFDTLINTIKEELNIDFFYKNNKGLRESLDDYVFNYNEDFEDLDFFEIVDREFLFSKEIKDFIRENIDIYDTGYFHKDIDIILKSDTDVIPEKFLNIKHLINKKLEKIANVKLHVFRSVEDSIECNEYDEYDVIEYVDSFVEIY